MMEEGRGKKEEGFTLLELLVSIVLIVIISSCVYFAVNGALDSWGYCRDQLALQKVLTESMDKVISGSAQSYGMKDSLEIVAAGKTRLEFLPPWVDDTHASAGRDFAYTLNRRLKPGAAMPIGEIKMPETNRWRLVPVQKIFLENSETTQVKLGLSVPEDSELRFIFHPDYVTDPDTVKKIFWDAKTKEMMMDDGEKIESLSKNFFDVEILNVEFKYFTTNNEPVAFSGAWVDQADLQVITGMQVEIEAKLGEQTQKLVRFINLRNAPMRTGYLTLRKGMRIPIPDSKTVRALAITSLSGIGNNDILQLEALPKVGDSWRITIEFEHIGSSKPIIKKIDVEYPPQRSVITEYPRSRIDLGVNLMLLGPDGLYDYDDDEDVDDVVKFEGDVILYVNEMTIEGAGLFVRP